MRRLAPGLLIAITGCGFTGSPAKTDASLRDSAGGGDADAISIDMAVTDAAIDVPSGFVCIEGAIFTVCRPVRPANDLIFTVNEIINTENDVRCDHQSQGPANRRMCVMAANQIKLNAGVAIGAIGSEPLVFAAYSDLTVHASAMIDLTSRFGAPPSAGAGSNACMPDTGGDSATGGGGAGGSFGGRAGNGGSGHLGGGGGTAQTLVVTPIDHVRGGCQGAGGGNTPDNGGAGGGAIYLLSDTKVTIEMNAKLLAGGAGGSGGTVGAGGGGGGGSGGFIGLDAPLVIIDSSGLVAANGGGGGSGGTTANGGGVPGAPGGATADMPAGGGMGGGGAGGTGSIGPTLTGMSGANGMFIGAAGGGGGGAAGIVFIPRGQPTEGSVSPPPTMQ